MKISNLNVQFFLALVVPLLLAMGLIAIVILSIQQQAGVRSEVTRLETLLPVIAEEILHYGKKADLRRFVNMYASSQGEMSCEDVCIAWRLGDFRKVTPENCDNPCTVDRLPLPADTSKGVTVSFTGSVWAVFSYASKELIMSSPLINGNTVVGVLAITRPLEPLYKSIREESKIVFGYLLVNAIIFASVGLFRMVHLVARPIEKLIILANRYTSTAEIKFPLERTASEFGKLTNSLNEMLNRIEADNMKLRNTVKSLECANNELERNRKEMFRAEKLAAIGRLSAGLAHEIGNPLGIIQGYVDLLGSGDLSTEEKRQFVERASMELQRIDALIRQLLNLSRKADGNAETIHVQKLLMEMFQFPLLKKGKKKINVKTQFSAERDLVVARGDQLWQVFLNCLMNAVDAIEETRGDVQSGEISLCIENVLDEEKELLQIRIADNGVGLKIADMDTVFDPFFTTKEPGKGTGLGLYVSHMIMENLGGSIHIFNRQPCGAEVVIQLPCIQGSADSRVES